MRRTISTFALIAVVGATGCGATARSSVGPAATAGTPQPPPPNRSQAAAIDDVELNSDPGVIVPGQEIDVRLQTTLSSGTAEVKQEFEATTVADLTQRGEVLVPAGSVVSGVVTAVERAGRVDRTGSLTLSFTSIRVNGREHKIRAMATQVFESGGLREDIPEAGVGGAVGGVIGGLIGGVRGAIAGAVIGAGGAIAATEGKEVELPAGSIIRIRFDSALNVLPH